MEQTVEIFNFEEFCWRFAASVSKTAMMPSFVYLNDKYMLRIGEEENTYASYNVEDDEWIVGLGEVSGVLSTRSSYLLVEKSVFQCQLTNSSQSTTLPPMAPTKGTYIISNYQQKNLPMCYGKYFD